MGGGWRELSNCKKKERKKKPLPIRARNPTKKKSVKEWQEGLNSCAYSPHTAVSLQFRHEMAGKKAVVNIRKEMGK